MGSALVVLFLCLSFLHAATGSHVSSAAGLSVDQIHPNSTESPIFHGAAIHRSAARADKFREVAPPYPPQSVLDSGAGLTFSALLYRRGDFYLLKFGIGSQSTHHPKHPTQPSHTVYAMFDTGSDMTWVLCFPCDDCYRHNSEIFDPKESYSNRIIPCRSGTCDLFEHSPCDGERSECKITVKYFDQSLANCTASTETLWFDNVETTNKVEPKKVVVRRHLYGCAHHTEGHFSPDSDAVFGANAHNNSFIGKLRDLIEGMFCYCLPSEEHNPTVVIFGHAAIVSGPGAVSTKLYLSEPNFEYKVALLEIFVDDRKGKIFSINYTEHTASRPNGNYLEMDSGTEFSFIAGGAMDDLIEILVNIMYNNQRVGVPKYLADDLDLCLNWKNPTKLPKITFVFGGNAQVILADPFLLIKRQKKMCLKIGSADLHYAETGIFGHTAQERLRIGINIRAKTATFLPEDC